MLYQFFPPALLYSLYTVRIVLSPLWFVRASVVPFWCSDPVYTLITIVVVIVFGYMFCSLLEYVWPFSKQPNKNGCSLLISDLPELTLGSCPHPHWQFQLFWDKHCNRRSGHVICDWRGFIIKGNKWPLFYSVFYLEPPHRIPLRANKLLLKSD